MFVLPDEVGGTHPALVEAMGYGNCVLANNTASNLEVIGDSGFSYPGKGGAEALQLQLQILLDRPSLVGEYRQLARKRAQEHYRWETVVEQHVRSCISRYWAWHDNRSRLSSLNQQACKQPCLSPTAEVREPLSCRRIGTKPLHTCCKRIFDIVVSACLLLLLCPVLLLLALVVKLTSPGPALYPWKVVGRNGALFTGYKFRSMVANADDLKNGLMIQNEMSGPVFKMTQRSTRDCGRRLDATL